MMYTWQYLDNFVSSKVLTVTKQLRWPIGLVAKASASGAVDSGLVPNLVKPI